MSLGPVHEQIVRFAFALLEADQVALAGGGAMLAHDLVNRPTQDVDLFTRVSDEVGHLANALAAALRASEAHVDLDQRGSQFSRLTVTMPDGRAVTVEIARDFLRDALRASTAHADTAFTELGLDGETIGTLRGWASQWREELRASSNGPARGDAARPDVSPYKQRPPATSQNRNGPSRSL